MKKYKIFSEITLVFLIIAFQYALSENIIKTGINNKIFEHAIMIAASLVVWALFMIISIIAISVTILIISIL
jgi:hypothetical protein